MKLFCSISDKLGGAEKIIYYTASYYANNLNQKVIIIFYRKKSNNNWANLSQKNNIYIYYSNSNIFNFIKNIRIFKNYDLIFSTHISINSIIGILLLFKIIKTIKFVVRESTSVFIRYKGLKLFKYKILYWLGYRNINLIITQSELMKYQLVKNANYLKKRCNILTIKNPFIYPELNKLLNITDLNFKYIVSAGRLIYEKGFDILINSFAEINKIYPHIKLVLIGDGICKKELENICEYLNIIDKVIFLGYKENVFIYFKKAEMCVISSRIEGFPNVLLEMMSQNHKIVSTKCAGGIDEIQGIFIAETESVESLTNAMLKAITTNTSNNRRLFDNTLKEQSIENFINKINEYI